MTPVEAKYRPSRSLRELEGLITAKNKIAQNSESPNLVFDFKKIEQSSLPTNPDEKENFSPGEKGQIGVSGRPVWASF